MGHSVGSQQATGLITIIIIVAIIQFGDNMMESTLAGPQGSSGRINSHPKGNSNIFY